MPLFFSFLLLAFRFLLSLSSGGIINSSPLLLLFLIPGPAAGFCRKSLLFCFLRAIYNLPGMRVKYIELVSVRTVQRTLYTSPPSSVLKTSTPSTSSIPMKPSTSSSRSGIMTSCQANLSIEMWSLSEALDRLRGSEVAGRARDLFPLSPAAMVDVGQNLCELRFSAAQVQRFGTCVGQGNVANIQNTFANPRVCYQKNTTSEYGTIYNFYSPATRCAVHLF